MMTFNVVKFMEFIDYVDGVLTQSIHSKKNYVLH